MIVMEYMEGGSLADKLVSKEPLPDISVLKYLFQILEGVGFIHDRKLSHSDIKPENILFDKQDNLKISDFGIAVADSELQSRLPQLHLAASTESSPQLHPLCRHYRYMSPERLQGAKRSEQTTCGVSVRLSYTWHTETH